MLKYGFHTMVKCSQALFVDFISKHRQVDFIIGENLTTKKS